ncbi:MAG: ParB/RepB/Spo0J family partition protein [Promethearchaeota archaeon]
MSEVLTIPVTSIRENPVALRSVNKESESYVGLRDSVKQAGLLNPISVRKREDNVDGEVVEYYEIIDGLHRYTAALDCGFETIPVNVLSLDQTQVLEAQIMANAHKVETKPVEYTKQIMRILAANPTMTVSDLSARLAHAPSWIHQRLNLLKLAPEIQKVVDEGKMPVTNAVLLSKLPVEEQFAQLDAALSTATQEFAGVIATRQKELRSAAREGRSPEDEVFTPRPKSRKLSELKEEVENQAVAKSLCKSAGVKTIEEAFVLGVKYAISLDPVSVAAQEASYNERKEAAEEAKKKRAAARAAKKAEEAQARAEAAKVAAGL